MYPDSKAAFKKQVAADALSRHLLYLEIKEYGFLGQEDIGTEAYGDALILAAHSNADHSLQKAVLSTISKYHDKITEWNRQLIQQHLTSNVTGTDFTGPNRIPQIFNYKKDGISISCGIFETPKSLLYKTLHYDYENFRNLKLAGSNSTCNTPDRSPHLSLVTKDGGEWVWP